jgi:hypothetical protein
LLTFFSFVSVQVGHALRDTAKVICRKRGITLSAFNQEDSSDYATTSKKNRYASSSSRRSSIGSNGSVTPITDESISTMKGSKCTVNNRSNRKNNNTNKNIERYDDDDELVVFVNDLFKNDDDIPASSQNHPTNSSTNKETFSNSTTSIHVTTLPPIHSSSRTALSQLQLQQHQNSHSDLTSSLYWRSSSSSLYESHCELASTENNINTNCHPNMIPPSEMNPPISHPSKEELQKQQRHEQQQKQEQQHRMPSLESRTTSSSNRYVLQSHCDSTSKNEYNTIDMSITSTGEESVSPSGSVHISDTSTRSRLDDNNAKHIENSNINQNEPIDFQHNYDVLEYSDSYQFHDDCDCCTLDPQSMRHNTHHHTSISHYLVFESEATPIVSMKSTTTITTLRATTNDTSRDVANNQKMYRNGHSTNHHLLHNSNSNNNFNDNFNDVLTFEPDDTAFSTSLTNITTATNTKALGMKHSNPNEVLLMEPECVTSPSTLDNDTTGRGHTNPSILKFDISEDQKNDDDDDEYANYHYGKVTKDDSTNPNNHHHHGRLSDMSALYASIASLQISIQDLDFNDSTTQIMNHHKRSYHDPTSSMNYNNNSFELMNASMLSLCVSVE